MWSVSTSRARDTAQNALKCPLVAFLRLVGSRGGAPAKTPLAGPLHRLCSSSNFIFSFFALRLRSESFFVLLSCKGVLGYTLTSGQILHGVYIFSLCLLYMTFSKKRQRKRDVRRVSFRFLLAVRKTAPHFRFCLSVFRLERHAVGKLCRFLSSSETVLCAMLE